MGGTGRSAVPGLCLRGFEVGLHVRDICGVEVSLRCVMCVMVIC